MHKVEHANISNLTTMRTGGIAEVVYFPESPEELVSLIYELRTRGKSWSILGAGSNTLASSRGCSGVLICTTSMDWLSKTSPDTVVAGAGLRLPKLALQAAQMNLSGCEFFEGIPGSVGGAVIMNAGAHNHKTSDILEKVTLFDTHKLELLTLVPSQLEFGYRHSNIDPQRFLVLEAKFRLKDGTSTHILDTMKEYAKQRASKQPRGFSSGCIFRNPNPVQPAGKLIDEMGLKGLSIGGAEVSPIHANFIMNSTGASSESICNLMYLIQAKAWLHKGVWLKPEVQKLGDFSEKDNIIWIHPERRPDNWLELCEIRIAS